MHFRGFVLDNDKSHKSVGEGASDDDNDDGLIMRVQEPLGRRCIGRLILDWDCM